MKESNTLMNTNTNTNLEQLKACTEDVVDTETTEDMMYPDCSSHFITKDMEAEYAPTDVS